MTKPLIIQENIGLASLTTFKIGGEARYFVRATSEDSVVEALEFATSKGLPVFILGGGSNVLIADAGFDGLVMQIALKGILRDAAGMLIAQAGEDWDTFVSYCVDNDLAGVETLSGIPGLVGGTPVQNVGAYGQEVAETIVSVRCYDRNSQEFVTVTNTECVFTYRTSIFNSTQRNRYIVLSVTFALEKGGTPKTVYKDLIGHFGERQPSLREVRDAVLQIRRSKSMVIDADDPNLRSAGSFFKNPIISREKLTALHAEHGILPSFPFGNAVKIPAAWLIENAGFHKGFALGNAGLSSKHTLAVINRGGASAADILLLKSEIQAAVSAKFSIKLHPEPEFVGF